MASPEGTTGSGARHATKGLGVSCQELLRKGPSVPVLDANIAHSSLTQRRTTHAHARAHSLTPASSV